MRKWVLAFTVVLALMGVSSLFADIFGTYSRYGRDKLVDEYLITEDNIYYRYKGITIYEFTPKHRYSDVDSDVLLSVSVSGRRVCDEFAEVEGKTVNLWTMFEDIGKPEQLTELMLTFAGSESDRVYFYYRPSVVINGINPVEYFEAAIKEAGATEHPLVNPFFKASGAWTTGVSRVYKFVLSRSPNKGPYGIRLYPIYAYPCYGYFEFNPIWNWGERNAMIYFKEIKTTSGSKSKNK